MKRTIILAGLLSLVLTGCGSGQLDFQIKADTIVPSTEIVEIDESTELALNLAQYYGDL